MYKVIVGNKVMLEIENKLIALDYYNTYVKCSKSESDLAWCQKVALTMNDEPIMEYNP